jgi:hypothetical protein
VSVQPEEAYVFKEENTSIYIIMFVLTAFQIAGLVAIEVLNFFSYMWSYYFWRVESFYYTHAVVPLRPYPFAETA